MGGTKPKRPGVAATGVGRKRAVNPMPPDVGEALERAGLVDAFRSRPPYQRNDYLGWIARAKREATREKRLDQMIRELRQGDLYMNMRWRPRGRPF